MSPKEYVKRSDRISELEHRVVPVLVQFSFVTAAYVFGSVLEEQVPVNDLDLAVITSLTSGRELDAYEQEIKEKIGKINGLEVDLTLFPDVRALSPRGMLFCLRTIHNGRRIYLADVDHLGDFLETLSKQYAAMYPRYHRARREVLEDLRS